MGLKIDNETVSKRAWGDVDKGALGRRLAELYAAGDATKAQIREVYASVPEEAFGKDSEGEPTFAYTKAWGPHHELQGDTIVLNRGGVHAAAGALAGARAEPDLSSAELASAKRHVRRHYRSLEEDVPEGLAEGRRRVERGEPLEELVKGSLDYTLAAIHQAFHDQFGMAYEIDLWVVEVFRDHVIVNGQELPIDEFYWVPFSREEQRYVFAPRDEWEVVQLTYEPQGMMEETVSTKPGGQTKRFVEHIEHAVRLAEARDGERRTVRGFGVTADVVNENNRRYPAAVIRQALGKMKAHLHESAGQGRVIQLLGEPEHPSEKLSRRPQILETVIKWNEVGFDGTHTLLEGEIIPTSKGQDILAILESGVRLGLSQRGYGYSEMVEENGRVVEQVTELTITGYDLKLPGEQSDPEAGITVLESREELGEMKLNLEMLKEQYPELVAQILQEHDEKKRQELEEELLRRKQEDERIQQLVAGQETELRETLGLEETADLVAAVRERSERLTALEEAERQRQVDEYVAGQIGEIKGYPEWLRKQMAEAVQAAKPTSIEEAKGVIVAKRKEYDAIMAKLELARVGYSGVGTLGPVLERETGTPQFAQVGFELQESMRRSGLARAWDPRKPTTVNEQFAALYLERFDKLYRPHLLRELREWEEAEQTSDLSLPYSVSRAVVAEAFPLLVATSIFDFGMTDQGTFRLYYEAFAGETGYTVSVTDEDVTADHDAWVAMSYKRVTPGTVVVTNSAGTVTYTEGTDYVIDYANGKLMALSTGSITDSQALKVDYTYTAIRKGEMAAIERGKMTLSYVTVDAAADRLATQISNEAIVFSRSQLGWDATARTLASLVKQVQRKIDQGILYLALAAALRVANNSGGTWDSANDSLDDLVEKIGLAKVKVYNRYYEPTAIVISVTNSDRLSNWSGFKRDGFPDAVLNANGFAGRVKGLPVFESTEFSDGYILPVNRELVMHRVYQPMVLKGPYPSYDVSGGTSKLIAADQYYAEEYNATEAPVSEKGAYVVVI